MSVTINLNAKKIVNTLNMAALLAFFIIYTSDAFAQRGRNGRGRYPVPQYPNSQMEVVKAKLYGQMVHGPTTLPLKRIIKQHNHYVQLQGKKLNAVIVKAQKVGYYGRGSVQLLINGVPEGRPIRLTEYGMDKIVIPVWGPKMIGRDIRTIKLKVHGTVRMKMIGFKLQDSRMTRCGPPRGHTTGRRGHGRTPSHQDCDYDPRGRGRGRY